LRIAGTVKSSFFVKKAIDQAMPFSVENYPLKNSTILDSASTIHIFNEISRFTDFRTADPGDFVWAGKEKVPIQGYGTIDIMVTVPSTNNSRKRTTKKVFRIRDVAYCPPIWSLSGNCIKEACGGTTDPVTT
jgi:hypothetical protein